MRILACFLLLKTPKQRGQRADALKRPVMDTIVIVSERTDGTSRFARLLGMLFPDSEIRVVSRTEGNTQGDSLNPLQPVKFKPGEIISLIDAIRAVSNP